MKSSSKGSLNEDNYCHPFYNPQHIYRPCGSNPGSLLHGLPLQYPCKLFSCICTCYRSSQPPPHSYYLSNKKGSKDLGEITPPNRSHLAPLIQLDIS